MNRLIVWERLDAGFEQALAIHESEDRKALEALQGEYMAIRPELRCVIEKLPKAILPGGVR